MGVRKDRHGTVVWSSSQVAVNMIESVICDVAPHNAFLFSLGGGGGYPLPAAQELVVPGG